MDKEDRDYLTHLTDSGWRGMGMCHGVGVSDGAGAGAVAVAGGSTVQYTCSAAQRSCLVQRQAREETGRDGIVDGRSRRTRAAGSSDDARDDAQPCATHQFASHPIKSRRRRTGFPHQGPPALASGCTSVPRLRPAVQPPAIATIWETIREELCLLFWGLQGWDKAA